MKFYSLNKIKSKKAQFNIIFGERSSGKSFACYYEAIETYYKKGKQSALIRRYDEDFKGKRGMMMFNGVVASGKISKLTNGQYNAVYYYASKWYLCRTEEGKKVEQDENPFCFGFSLTAMEHDKSTSYDNITTIVFDEFITRTAYLPDEFVLFCNVLSTIIRHRTDVIIYMLGNSVNKFCPYFKEMGLKHIREMSPGDLDVYSYGDQGLLKVAVEYTEPNAHGKPSDIYFTFDNPKLKMITGGAWEIDIYPHLPMKYKPKEIAFTFYIKFDNEMLCCEIIEKPDCSFIYIHRKSGDLKHPEEDLIYSTEYNPLPNWRRSLARPIDDLDRTIMGFFNRDKVFYQDNDVGEIVRNYLLWAK